MSEIKAEHVKKFRTLAKAMDKLMREICEYNPEANLYIEDSCNANLMKGPSHDNSRNCRPLHENVVSCEHIHRASGGGW